MEVSSAENPRISGPEAGLLFFDSITIHVYIDAQVRSFPGFNGMELSSLNPVSTKSRVSDVFCCCPFSSHGVSCQMKSVGSGSLIHVKSGVIPEPRTSNLNHLVRTSIVGGKFGPSSNRSMCTRHLTLESPEPREIISESLL